MNFDDFKKKGKILLDKEKEYLKNQIQKLAEDLNMYALETELNYKKTLQDINQKIDIFINQKFKGVTKNNTIIADRIKWEWDVKKWQTDISVSTYTLPTGHYVRLGHISFSNNIEPFKIPYFIPFINQNHLLFHVNQSSINSANQCIESIVYQILTSIHPSLVKITAIDTVGLGKNFSKFSPLCTQIKGLKIYHGKEVEIILEKLIEHMALVTQKYLSTNYESLDAYNQFSRVVSEPYHLVCISNFPENLSDEAIKNILTIASNGTKVGIHLLISLSKDIKFPKNLDIGSLSRYCVNISQTNLQFSNVFEIPNIVDPIKLDDSPSNELVNQISSSLNQQIQPTNEKEKEKVSLLSTIVNHDYWKKSSSHCLEIDIGLIDSKNILLFTLGKNVHHALIAGKTGMGKTVLLHNLICKSALLYSPLELEFYMLDFKEGVEFKIYKNLPHMNTLVIDAQRDHGLSILDKIEKEIKHRGDKFKLKGNESIRDIYTYRQHTNDIMSRIILIIDEFQVLFQYNDKISTEARVKLDYITRLGRSFGIHVILSTQSLIGVDIEYSTLSQIGIRIAFALNELDAIKVLGSQNDVAKYLSIPGEAIFNEDNQLVASNKKFQTYFAKDKDWYEICQYIKSLEVSKKIHTHQPIVEINTDIIYQDNHHFSYLLDNPPIEIRNFINLFLGKDFSLNPHHLSITLSRKIAQNILMIGDDEIAISLCFGMIVSLLLSIPKSMIKIKLINYDNFNFTHLNLEGSLEIFPLIEEEKIIQDVYDLIIQRENNIAKIDAKEPIFLILYGVHYSKNIQTISNFSTIKSNFDKNLNTIISRGPSLGIHLILWSNQYAKIKNNILINYLSEFDYKIIFSNEAKSVVNLSTNIKSGLAYLASKSSEAIKFKPYKLRLDNQKNDFQYYSKYYHSLK
jgi:S-DNA-T family DNA segregation ATPase FtsK/SpoIIIE